MSRSWTCHYETRFSFFCFLSVSQSQGLAAEAARLPFVSKALALAMALRHHDVRYAGGRNVLYRRFSLTRCVVGAGRTAHSFVRNLVRRKAVASGITSVHAVHGRVTTPQRDPGAPMVAWRPNPARNVCLDDALRVALYLAACRFVSLRPVAPVPFTLMLTLFVRHDACVAAASVMTSMTQMPYLSRGAPPVCTTGVPTLQALRLQHVRCQRRCCWACWPLDSGHRLLCVSATTPPWTPCAARLQSCKHGMPSSAQVPRLHPFKG